MSHYYNNDHGPRLVFAKEGGEGLHSLKLSQKMSSWHHKKLHRSRCKLFEDNWSSSTRCCKIITFSQKKEICNLTIFPSFFRNYLLQCKSSELWSATPCVPLSFLIKRSLSKNQEVHYSPDISCGDCEQKHWELQQRRSPCGGGPFGRLMATWPLGHFSWKANHSDKHEDKLFLYK